MTEGGGFFLDHRELDEECHKGAGEDVSHGRRPGNDPCEFPTDVFTDEKKPRGSEDRYTRVGCSRCVSLSYSEDLHRAFGVHICGACRKGVTLISKTTAKQQYLLTDTDLKQLGSLERKNPRQIDWNPMKLYMESQVRNVAHAKYGGQAGLEWEARVKVSKKLESRIQEKERRAFESARKSKRIKQIRESLKVGEIENESNLVKGVEEDI